MLGTAALGLPYGLPQAGGGAPGLIPEAEAAALVRAALAAGIGTFDTAPAYGCAEERLGRALGGAAAVWTKLAQDRGWDAAEAGLRRSLDRLGRSRLDLLQVHNWSPGLEDDPGFRRALDALARDGRVAALGCSTYGGADCLAAVRQGRFAVVQCEWSLLDQETVALAGAEAQRRGVRLAVRSVLLQGVLAGRELPPRLAALAPARERAAALARELGTAPARLALRAALFHPWIAHALVGAAAPAELDEALAAAAEGPLPAGLEGRLAALHLGKPATDPRTWRA